MLTCQWDEICRERFKLTSEFSNSGEHARHKALIILDLILLIRHLQTLGGCPRPRQRELVLGIRYDQPLSSSSVSAPSCVVLNEDIRGVGDA